VCWSDIAEVGLYTPGRILGRRSSETPGAGYRLKSPRRLTVLRRMTGWDGVVRLAGVPPGRISDAFRRYLEASRQNSDTAAESGA
jgi:hypothetical protein